MGLLAQTVPTALGGSGAGALDAARIINIFGKADPSTALVLSMHYIQHLVMARSTRWPGRLARKLARETVEGVALINALRVEPDLGSSVTRCLAGDDRAKDRDGMASFWTKGLA
jgi:alkylation response protein AidB-like acyl-CoA dehydrogenase